MIRPPATDLDPGPLRDDLDAHDLDATTERFRSSMVALLVWTLIVMVIEVLFFPELRWQSIGFASAMVSLGLPAQILLRRGRFPIRHLEAFSALLLVLRMTHLGLAYYRSGSSFYPLLLMNVMITGAGVSLTLRWLVVALAVGCVPWAAGLFRHAAAAVDLIGGITVFASTCLASGVLYLARVRHTSSMERMRARDRRQGEELATALAAAERELQDRRQAEEERERLRDQLSHAQKMEAVGTLAGGFAHDLNNMLGVVIGLAEIVRESTSGQVREDVDQILASCKRGSELTRNLLGFSRRGQYRVERIDMASVVREVSRLLSRTIPKSVTLDVELDQGAHVLGDSTQLGQVLMNLCLNSVDAMPDGGHLLVRVVRVVLDEEKAARAAVQPGPHVAMSVADSGCGMSEETRQRMFEPFFTTRRERGGTGLGLAMVYGTTMKHNGGIVVESAAGAGTRITLYLPYASREDAARAAAAAESSRPQTPEALDVLAAGAAQREPSPLISRHIAIIGEAPALESGPRKSAPISMLLSQVMPVMADVTLGVRGARAPTPPREPASARPPVHAPEPAPRHPPTPRPLPAPPSLPPPVADDPADTVPMAAMEDAPRVAPVDAPTAEPPPIQAPPAEVAPSAAIAAPSPAEPDARGCILIVDDEPMVRAVVRRTLRRAGYRVLEAADGVEGVDVFERNRADIDLVILDMAMPIMGGAACFTHLRELDPDARVILASGFAAEEDAQGCLRRGAICFLEKPYTSAALLAAIAGALEPGSAAARPPTGQVALVRAAE